MRHPLRIALSAAALAVGACFLCGEEPLAASSREVSDASAAGASALRARPDSGVVGSAPASRAGAFAEERAAATPPVWRAPHATEAGVEGRGAQDVALAAGMRADSAPRLDRPSVASGAVTVEVTGFDPGGPRTLTLWRVGREGAARLGVTRSEAGGRFAFPAIAVVESELAVTAAGEGVEAARSRVRLGALPPPVAVAVRQTAADGDVVRIWPSAGAARVIVAEGGSEIAVRDVAQLPSGQERMAWLALGPARAGAVLWVTEEDPEGRRAGWRKVDVAP